MKLHTWNVTNHLGNTECVFGHTLRVTDAGDLVFYDGGVVDTVIAGGQWTKALRTTD